MNHKAIVIKQLNDQATRLEAELAGVRAAITALGGTTRAAAGPGKPVQRRSRKAKGKASPAQLAGLAKARATRAANVAKVNGPAKPEGAVLSEAAS